MILSLLKEKQKENLNDPINTIYLKCNQLLTTDNPFMDSCLTFPLELDLRVCIRWDEPQTNVELHVIEPNGTHCNPFNNHTESGLLSIDCHGFGPVIYSVRTAMKGTYIIRLKLFWSHSSFPVTVNLAIWTHFGTLQQTLYTRTIPLLKQKQDLEVARVLFPF